MEKMNLAQEDFLTNVAYLTSIALDLLIRESEKMLNAKTPPEGWRYEKKRMFSQFTDYVRKACIINDQLITQDVYDVEEKNNYKYVQVWQEEANELARTILLIADKQSNGDAIDKIQAFIRSIPGDGIVTEELLDKFRLKKL